LTDVKRENINQSKERNNGTKTENTERKEREIEWINKDRCNLERSMR
jgi:hypothetical protein